MKSIKKHKYSLVEAKLSISHPIMSARFSPYVIVYALHKIYNIGFSFGNKLRYAPYHTNLR